MTSGCDGLYMTIPEESLPAVIFRAARLHENGTTLIPWTAELVESTDAEATIRLLPQGELSFNGYLLVGHAFRLPSGNLELTHAPGLVEVEPIDSLPPECSICGTKRARYHFVLRKDQEIVSAGYQCLVKAGFIERGRLFTGFFPAATLDPRIPLSETVQRVMARPTFDTLECLAVAISDYRNRGYISKRRSTREGIPSTAALISEAMAQRQNVHEPSSEISNNLLAAAVMKSQILGHPDVVVVDGDFAQKSIAALKRERIQESSIPYIAALPRMFATGGLTGEAPVASESAWIGAIGERVDLECTLKSVMLIHRDFGTAFQKITFQDSNGLSLSWFTGAPISMPIGSAVHLRGTVKRHQMYNGVKETVLSRCKISGR